MIEGIETYLRLTATTLHSVEVIESVEVLAEVTAYKTGSTFVIPYRERAKPNTRATGGHLQEVQAQIVVAFLVRNVSDGTGAARAKQFDGYKTDIEAALAGWEPDFVTSAFELVGGESTALSKGVSLYAQTWETSRFLTGVTE